MPAGREPLQNILHQAPLREGGLEQVQPHEGREQEPPWADPPPERQADQDERSGNRPDLVLEAHFFLGC